MSGVSMIDCDRFPIGVDGSHGFPMVLVYITYRKDADLMGTMHSLL